MRDAQHDGDPARLMRWTPDGELTVVYETRGRRAAFLVRAALRRRHDHRDGADASRGDEQVSAPLLMPLEWPGE